MGSGAQTGQSKPVILVVEDDLDTQIYMKTILSSRYEVLIAGSGREVREMLDDRPGRIDLVLMDLSLKTDEDGLMLTRHLRATDEWKDLPIIAVTAHAFATDRRNALTAGCNAFVTKPFDYKELLAMIDRLTGPGNG